MGTFVLILYFLNKLINEVYIYGKQKLAQEYYYDEVVCVCVYVCYT